jgi:superfamily II DNA helicase RecQ
MAYKIFQVPAYGGEESEQVLNKFLGNHRILCVSKEFVNAGSDSFWSFCVDYLEQGSGGKDNGSGRRRSKVDYKEILDADEFTLFAKLRDLRKELAQSEAVPVYAIFTNEQLAHIVQQRVASKASLHSISGLGDARVNKYGERVLEITRDYWSKLNEESGSPVCANPG